MRIRPAILITVISLLGTAFTCEDDHIDMYIHDANTEESVYSIVQTDLLSPSFRMIELAEVFSGYQKIRSEREKALRYVEGFFNTRYNIFYEYMHIDYWGQINLVSEYLYTATPDNWVAHWIALNMHREVTIQSPEEHVFVASSTSEKDIWDIKAEVADYVINMTDLHAFYETDIFGRPTHMAEIEIIESLKMPMCRLGKGKLEPTAGRISISYRSDEATKAFEVEFHENSKTFYLPDGSSRTVDPEPTYHRSEY